MCIAAQPHDETGGDEVAIPGRPHGFPLLGRIFALSFKSYAPIFARSIGSNRDSFGKSLSNLGLRFMHDSPGVFTLVSIAGSSSHRRRVVEPPSVNQETVMNANFSRSIRSFDRHAAFAGLFLCGVLSCAQNAFADAVTDWNEIAAGAVTVGRPGPTGPVDLALVQVAVHDAVQAIDRRFEPYYAEVPRAHGSRAAAAAAAAHGVLVGFYPTQAATLDATYFNYLADKGLTGNPGLEVGAKVAAAILPLRRLDPDPLPAPFTGRTGIGEWRPTDSLLGNPPIPPPFSPMAAPWLATFKPLTLTGPARFRAPPPPAVTSDRYTRDYNEVRALGSLNSTQRTAGQTDLAYFYTENFVTQWNRALRGIAASRLHKIGDSARLFALANLATADALITAWDSKKFYNFWRPITAIREGENDGNPATAGDLSWQPLINTPNYPDYTSGANNVTGAMTRTLALFFHRDRMTFQVTSLAPLAVKKTRTYERLSDAAQDVVDARVYLGIHFRFADTAARTQGKQVAEWTFSHFLRPLESDDAQ
ncbi:MAG TPA: vanadium-dependent haloperoxidase [Steroidobacteraceae bacterium]|nr:vanadium-dependent haloperoxidase [Steroidobacteraceae bacterium]